MRKKDRILGLGAIASIILMPVAVQSQPLSGLAQTWEPRLNLAQAPTSEPEAAPAATAYPQEVVDAFVGSCQADGSTPPEFCTCTITELQQRLPFEDFVQWSQTAGAEAADPPPEFQASVETCVAQTLNEQSRLMPRLKPIS